MRTIKNIKQFLTPVEKVIKDNLISTLFNDSQISQELRKLLSLPCKFGGLGNINPVELADEEYNNSRQLTTKLTNLIIQQEHEYLVSEKEIKDHRAAIQRNRAVKQQTTLNLLRDNMSYMETRLNDILQEQGTSS